VFQAWNIIDSLFTDHTTGHQLWEPRMLARELHERGVETRLFGHLSIKGEDFPEARCIPTFPLYYGERVSEDRSWGFLENFIVHNRSYEEALIKAGRPLFENALVLFPNVSVRHLLGIIRWLDRFDDQTRPCAVLLLGALRDWSSENPALPYLQKLWAECPYGVKDNVTLCVRTEAGARAYEQLLGELPHVLPSPLGPTEIEIETARHRTGALPSSMVVSFLGGARQERGALMIPEIVRLCGSIDVRFNVQLTDSWELGSNVAALKTLGVHPHVRLHEGTLSREEYNDWMAESVVLLPYDAESYRWRSSGVYLEARCFGAPVIVPAGTWMADEVARLGHGLIVEQYTPAAIAEAIAKAKNELSALRVRASASAVEFRKHHGADRCVDAVHCLAERSVQRRQYM